MNVPRSRRALLTTFVTLAVFGSGCSETDRAPTEQSPESAVVPPDRYDCDDVDRPLPDVPSDPDALKPQRYPSPPSSLSSGGGQYVTAFERAYQRNAFLERFGNETRSFEFRLDARQADEIGSERATEAVLVSIVYDLSTGTRQANSSPGDEWDTRVTYYADEHVLLRSRYEGIADVPSFDPDPRTTGDPVACFD